VGHELARRDGRRQDEAAIVRILLGGLRAGLKQQCDRLQFDAHPVSNALEVLDGGNDSHLRIGVSWND